MTIFADDFNRANNADLGASWTPFTGRALQILTNAAAPSAVATTASEFYTGTAPPADHFSQASISILVAASDSEAGVGVRSGTTVGTWTAYYGYASNRGGGETTAIIELLAGSATTVASENATTWAAGDVLKLSASGTDLVVYRNGALLLSGIDATIATGTHALYIYTGTDTANVAIDDFIGSDLGNLIHRTMKAEGHTFFLQG